MEQKSLKQITAGDIFVPQTRSDLPKSNWIITDLDIDSLLKELRQKTLPSSSDLEVRSKGGRRYGTIKLFNFDLTKVSSRFSSTQ